MAIREASRLFHGTPVSEGAGVRLKRAFGGRDLELFDPFLLFDDFSSHRDEDYIAGFPMHPHRGIETVTYILGGEVAHRDSIGNDGTIGPGGVQWMSAGSGIIHEEMPQRRPGGIRGFQLWVNLPSARKMNAPAYRDVKAAAIPDVIANGARVKVIAGAYGGESGGVHGARNSASGLGIIGGDAGIAGAPTYLDVSLEKGASFDYPVASGDTALLYVADGRIAVDTQRTSIPEGTIVVTGAGDELHVEAVDGATSTNSAGANGGSTSGTAARFLVMIGTPLKEPVAWHGPIVMNSDEELRTALGELRDGTFIKGR